MAKVSAFPSLTNGEFWDACDELSRIFQDHAHLQNDWLSADVTKQHNIAYLSITKHLPSRDSGPCREDVNEDDAELQEDDEVCERATIRNTANLGTGSACTSTVESDHRGVQCSSLPELSGPSSLLQHQGWQSPTPTNNGQFVSLSCLSAFQGTSRKFRRNRGNHNSCMVP